MEPIQQTDAYLKVVDVGKKFGKFTALEGVSFRARRGEFLSVLGPSGCGKTTVLRIVAGLETQTSGKVFIEDCDVSHLPVSKRNVGIVFQSYALFPNLTAGQNIAYGLRSRREDSKKVTQRVGELIELVGLGGMENKHPAQLSGGQQQRVALARAMALSPDLLLLDEPLSALDAKVRIMLRSEIRQLQQRLGVTTIMVTHDQEEALTMADRILVMNQGGLVQNGTPLDIYDRPATPFVAAFIGSMNFIDNAIKIDRGVYGIGDRRLAVAPENGAGKIENGQKVRIAIRPEDIVIRDGLQGERNTISTRVESMEYRGPLFRLALRFDVDAAASAIIEADVPSEKIRRLNIREQIELSVQLPLDRLHVYRRPGQVDRSP
ncbi:MAG: putative 2-aminoethylphosphonate ABC transporter ATP-binding protein [Desulfobacterales bacterium]|jgi:iron(III) transport system ATP-binding protein